MSEDRIKLQGIMSEGYGVIPKKVMKDKTLTIEAKAIYAFMASYSGNGNTSYPSVEYITDLLDISRHRFNRHRKLLEEKGYISVRQERKKGSKFNHNIYTLEFVPQLQFTTSENRTSENRTSENDTTNNNTINNNTINNNTNKNKTLSGNPTALPYKEIIEYLNDKAGKQYKHTTKKTQSLIKARINEGFNMEDFKKVIDTKKSEWMESDMEKFLRPETLFGTKFESYLNQSNDNNPVEKTKKVSDPLDYLKEL